jgi:hypothetical protein
MEVTARGELRETSLESLPELPRCLPEHPAKALIEAEAVVLPAREVEDDELGLVPRQAKAAAKLLQEDGRALCRTEEEQRVDVRDVDPLVVDVDDTEDLDDAEVEVAPGLASFSRRRFASEHLSAEASSCELFRDDPGVPNGSTEGDRSKLLGTSDVLGDRSHGTVDEQVGGADQLSGELVGG